MNYIFVLLIALCFSKVALAQADKVDAQRVSFITDKVKLTTTEAQSFWPLYNEYNDKVKALRKNFRANYGNKEDFKSDKEAEDFINAEINLKQSEVDLKKEYTEKFKKVLGVKKTAMLRKAEEEFLRILINTAKGNGS
ncbi:MAG TPA: hypothetical protein VN026_11565 [Bacteroidia bacterium]|nr:hypothetical protein [Bacteroidia bacterium]